MVFREYLIIFPMGERNFAQEKRLYIYIYIYIYFFFFLERNDYLGNGYSK